jgi:hypothetical protein
MKSWSVGLWLAVVVLQTQASERWVFEGKTGIGAAPVDGVIITSTVPDASI